MKASLALQRRLHWINLPTAALVALLQRSPVLRVVAVAEEYVLSSRIAALLKSAFVASTSLGAVHSLAGATALSSSQASPVSVAAGANVSIGFAITGTLSEPESWLVGGSVPPGLTFTGGVTSGTINAAQLLLSGAPTTAGSYTMNLRATDAGTGLSTPTYNFTIDVTGAASSAPTFSTHPQSQSGGLGANLTLSVAAAGTPAPTLQWRRNGTDLAGATGGSLAVNNLQPQSTGVYLVVATNSAGSANSNAAIVGVTTTSKVVGAGNEVQGNIPHPNGNIFDQVLLTGTAETITSDFSVNQVTRTSFIDLDNDIVQIEFSGPGTLSLVLDQPSGPAAPTNYNQQLDYMKGHAGIVITGADERTNVSVFTVGRATAFDPTGGFNIIQAISATNNPANNGSALFQGHANTSYDGIADIAFIAIASTNGRFGGVRTANAHYFAAKGITGVYAPGVTIEGPLFLGDLSAFDAAKPMIQVGAAANARVTGGDLAQANGEAVQVNGLTQLTFTAGSDSHGNTQARQTNQAVLRQNGQDVTAQLVNYQ